MIGKSKDLKPKPERSNCLMKERKCQESRVDPLEQILFSHNPMKARAGSFFEREVNFLKDLGYTFKQKNQWTWEAVK
jgi:hypothetical protein